MVCPFEGHLCHLHADDSLQVYPITDHAQKMTRVGTAHSWVYAQFELLHALPISYQAQVVS